MFISLVFFILVSNANSAEKVLNFSNTQHWDFRFKELMNSSASIILNSNKLDLASPPTNDSQVNQEEVKYLLSLQNERSLKDIANINGQLFVWEFKIGEFKIGRLKQLGYPKLDSLLQLTMPELVKYLFAMKFKYNRVRPEFLDARIKPSITTPPHPSYPSAHAGQSHYCALLLSYFDPSNRESYFRDADQIGKNRELAGVHYPSDTKAGIELADKFFELILQSKNPKLVNQILLVKKEFDSKK